MDHPRTRGEKKVDAIPLLTGKGSPPHARGKVCKVVKVSRRRRITPARAGKRSLSGGETTGRRDHPRTRGEKWHDGHRKTTKPGSPPHARGKGNYVKSAGRLARITPAHAGKSEPAGRSRRGKEDHPRTRGEKRLRHFIYRPEPGSPPHTRGKARHS